MTKYITQPPPGIQDDGQYSSWLPIILLVLVLILVDCVYVFAIYKAIEKAF